MALTYGFFNSIDHDRKYNAENIGRYLQGLVSSGVYADSSTSLQVLAGDGLKVNVQAGRAMLDFHYMENDGPLSLTLASGDTQDRIDAIVARLDMSNRRCEIVVKKGTPATSPAAPAVTRSDVVKEYMLASIYVTKMASAITQDNITDTRPDNSVCGWVHTLIDKVDTETLFRQYEAAYSAKMAELDSYVTQKKAEIDSRLDSIDEAINNAGSTGVPIPTASNSGMLPQVNERGDAYELVNVLDLYVWEKYNYEPVYTKKDVTSAQIGVKMMGEIDVTYALEISITDGSVSLVGEQEITVTSEDDATLDIIKGKYIKFANSIYLIHSDATFSTKTSGSGTGMTTSLYASSATMITADIPEPVGYVGAKTADAYPSNGEHTDSCWYVYKKRLGE